MIPYADLAKIQEDVFNAYKKALYNGDITPIKSLRRLFKQQIEQAKKPPQSISEIERNTINSASQDMRTSELIVKECHLEHEKQMMVFNHPRREGFIKNLETARETLDNLSIGYRAYTPLSNAKNMAYFAFWHAAVAVAIPAITNISNSIPLDVYALFAGGGAFIGAVRGAIDNNAYFKTLDKTTVYIRRSFRPK